MAEIKANDLVTFHGRVVKVDHYTSRDVVLVEDSTGRRYWVDKLSLQCEAKPLMVRCELGCDHPLTDFPTLRERCKALGLSDWDDPCLGAFMEICAELAEKGVTPQQFVEGLT